MKTIEDYIAFLKWAEADNRCRFLPYKDSKNIWTIGYGRNIQANPFTDQEISKCESMGGANEAFFTWILDRDVQSHMNEVLSKLPWLAFKPPAIQYFVTDLNFGMGWSELSKFGQTLGMLREGKYKETADHMPSTGWYKDVGRRSVRWCQILREVA